MQPMPTSPETIQVFYSYINEDKQWQKELETQLSGLHQNGLIFHWHQGLVKAGMERQREIDEHLNTAHIFLLLVSPGFLASAYCMDVEVKRALERLEQNEAHVIPIILKPCAWKRTTLGKFQSLPRDGRSVCEWSPSESSLHPITEEIHEIIEKQVAREWLNYGRRLHEINNHVQALKAFEQALQHNPGYVEAYNSIGETYYAQRKNEEALSAYESARKYDFKNIWAWFGIGNVYVRLKDDEKALDAYQQITTIDPINSWSAWAWYEQAKIQKRLNHLSEAIDAYERAIIAGDKKTDLALFHREKGSLYEKLERYTESLAEAEKALSLDPEYISSYRDKAHALNQLRRFDEALEVCEEALRRKPDYSNIHQAKGTALKGLERYQEALQEIEEAIRLKPDYMWAWKNKETTLKLLAQQTREEAEWYDKLAQEASEKAKQFGYKR